jgi:hypothetical protein
VGPRNELVDDSIATVVEQQLMDAALDEKYSSTGTRCFVQVLQLGERHELVVGAVDEENGSLNARHPRLGRKEQDVVDDLEREVTEHPSVGADEVLGGAQTSLGDGQKAADERHDRATGPATAPQPILLDRSHAIVPRLVAVDG